MSMASRAASNVMRDYHDTWSWRDCIASVDGYDDRATAHVDKFDHKNGLIALFTDGSYVDLRGDVAREYQATRDEEISIDDGVHYAVWLGDHWMLGQHDAVFDGSRWIAK